MTENSKEENVQVNKTLLKYKYILKKELGYKGKEIAKMMGIRASTYYSMTRNRNRALPKWVKAFVIVHEILDRKYRGNQCKCK
jgi:hypothetical protein